MEKTNAKFSTWINQRFPLARIWRNHASDYYVPKNLNFWYFFGAFSFVVLLNQIATGIWLTMYYEPSAAGAFNSVEHIMRDVKFGWLLRYMHSTGAAAFFIVIYLHMYRGIMYGSFKAPRELVWIFGMLLYALLLLEAASGYVLPWGQMSYWATKVMVEIYTVIPIIGKNIAKWISGDYNVSGITLHRFFAFHVAAFPMIIVYVVLLHIMALHQVGSNNPEGIEIKKHLDNRGKPLDGIPFHPYYIVKDFMGIVAFLLVFFVVVFFVPMMGGYFLEHNNFVQANPLITPAHIAPPWYLAPFYAMLRAIPNKLLGVVLVAAAIAVLFVLPWLDRSKVRSIRYRGIYSKVALMVFVITFIALGALGTMVLTHVNVWLSRFFMLLYFLFFITMPIYTKYEKTKAVPDRVTK